MTDRDRVADLEAANRALRERVRALRLAILPFARVGRSVTAEQAEAEPWLAAARRAAEVLCERRADQQRRAA